MSQDHENKIRALNYLANLPRQSTWWDRVALALQIAAWLLFLVALAGFILQNPKNPWKYALVFYRVSGFSGITGILTGLVATLLGRPFSVLASGANLAVLVLLPSY
jgi:hypothetical protein